MKTFLLIMAVILTMAMTPQTCFGQTAVMDGETPTVSVDYLAGLKGVTFCRDQGSFAFVRVGMTKVETAMVTVHEAKHMEQYARYPTCKGAIEVYRTPKGMLEMEAEAFAAGWCTAALMGADTVALRADILQLLMFSYVPGTSIFEISKAFERYARCP
jgi:hypothetical protein